MPNAYFLYTPNYTPHYTPYCFPLRELQLPRQRLLRTFRSQQRYLEVSTRSKNEFEASFEVIQISFGSIFDIRLRQRQNHPVDHEISWNFYTSSKGDLVMVKNHFYVPKRFEKLSNVFNWSKETGNIFEVNL